ncbi:hypothetical protein FB451DRAFT_79421 [Mycena latifolia]|nr:hypothetical protein FB451DRAFT_79421 [Mycena latifolia]
MVLLAANPNNPGSINNLSDLPPDILFAIMGFVDPHDILALRKVSTSLADATRERSVWIEALRRVCVHHDVYVHSFPLTEMSVDELEHSATSYRRLTARLRSEFLKRQVVSPLSIRYLEPASLGEDFDHLRFIPGGRFLLTMCGFTLRLWDLGHPAKATSLNLIASLAIDGATEILSVRTRARNSSSDVLVFVASAGCDRVFRLHIFSVFPPAPQFRPFAPVFSLPMDDGCPGILGITSRHVAFSTLFSTVLWDFVDDSWISWPQKRTESDDTLYICNAHAVIMHAESSQIILAALPTLHPRTLSTIPPEIGSLHIVREYPLRRYDQSAPLAFCVSGITLVFHGRETCTAEEPLHVDILSDNETKALLTHFAFVPTSDVDSTAACELVALGESPLEATYRASQSLHLEWAGPSSIQSFVLEGSTLHVCVSSVDGMTSSSISGVLATPGLSGSEINIDFCSFAGRGCVRIRTGDGYKVMVMDFLLPKPRK